MEDKQLPILAGRTALVTGLANERSLACGIASALAAAGAKVAITCQNERLQKKAEKIAAGLNAKVYLCDLAEDREIDKLATAIAADLGGLDIVVHAVAFAGREALQGGYMDHLDRKTFLQAHDISAWTLTALCQKLKTVLRPGGSVLTLSYLGAARVVPNYNVMGVAKAALEASVRYLAADLGPHGIRVNALSPGPVRTLAASGISGLRGLLQHVEQSSPLRRNISSEDVGKAAVMMCSSYASAITGQVLYVDSGYSILGTVGARDEPTA
ncbi:MAG: enoyl-ACP reductase FabI [Candidatus Porifericomitaceae bacterium WSBS_2022_MAG_OTU9]